MKRRPRKARTFDQFGGFDSNIEDINIPGVGIPASNAPIVWTPSSDPDFNQAIVPAGTPAEAGVLTIARNYPTQAQDTWYAPTTAAVIGGRVQAAADTISATGEKIASAAAGIGANLVPILLGLAALYVLFQWEKAH